MCLLCRSMPAPYVMADSNHISFQLFAKFSEPDMLALHCVIVHHSSEHLILSVFLSACSSLCLPWIKVAIHNNLKEVSPRCCTVPVTLISAVTLLCLLNISFSCLFAFLGLCFLLPLLISTCTTFCAAAFLHCCFSHQRPK